MNTKRLLADLAIAGAPSIFFEPFRCCLVEVKESSSVYGPVSGNLELFT